MISQTKARSAIEGSAFPSKNGLSPTSQNDSIVERDADRSFSPSAAAAMFTGRPNANAIVLLKIYPTERQKTSVTAC